MGGGGAGNNGNVGVGGSVATTRETTWLQPIPMATTAHTTDITTNCQAIEHSLCTMNCVGTNTRKIKVSIGFWQWWSVPAFQN